MALVNAIDYGIKIDKDCIQKTCIRVIMKDREREKDYTTFMLVQITIDLTFSLSYSIL